MLIKIGTDDMRKKMGEILDCVNLKGDEFVIERKNKPIAALIPMPKLQALRNLAQSYLVESMETHTKSKANKLSDEEIDALADEAEHKSRSKPKIKNAKS